MNSRQRRKIWRSAKLSMELDEKEREVRKIAQENRRTRLDSFRFDLMGAIRRRDGECEE